MAGFDISKVAPLMKEKLLDEPQRLYEVETDLVSWIKKVAKVYRISARSTALRIPLESDPGGITVGQSLSGGSFVAGGGTQYKEMTISTIGVSHNRQIDLDALYATASDEQAVVNGLASELAKAMVELKVQEEKWLQWGNDGALAIINTVAGAPTYSVAHASNPFGAQLLREGNQYDVYASDMATRRGTAAWTITQDGGIDFPGQNVTFTASITAAAQGDRIVAANLVNAGLSGLSLFFNSSSSGTVQGLSRSLPYMRAREVAAGSVSLETAFIRQALNFLKIRKGKDAAKNVVPFYAPQQEHAYEQLGVAISEIAKGGGNDELDLLFGDIKMAGKRGMCSINANPREIKFMVRDAFGRAELNAVKWYGAETGTTIWPVYDTSTGVPKATYWFGLVHRWNLVCFDLTALSFISGLAVPAGYVG